MQIIIKKIFLLILFVQLCSPKALLIGEDAHPLPVDTDKLKCLFNAGYLDEIFVIYKQLDDGSWVYGADITQIKKKFGISANIIFKPYLFSRNPIENQANTYAKFLKNLPIKMVWYSPAETTNNRDISCDYAFNFTLALAKKINVTIGIANNQQAWRAAYGFGNCTKFSSLYPLFFLGNQILWRSFGGWDSYTLQTIDPFELCFVKNLIEVTK